jgi:uncharacterized membrane protein YuzA (DUF378 family)
MNHNAHVCKISLLGHVLRVFGNVVMMGAFAYNLYYNLVGYMCSSKKSTYMLTLLPSLTLVQTFEYKAWKHGM